MIIYLPSFCFFFCDLMEPLYQILKVLVDSQVRTVKVSHVSLGATVQDIKEFFSFSGDIEYVEMKRHNSAISNKFF